MATNRDLIVDAIRAGAWSAADIARRVGMGAKYVAVELHKMREQGRVVSEHSRQAHAVSAGRPKLRWSVNKDWRPPCVQIPAWVAEAHRAAYREIAQMQGEHEAAHWARAAKALTKNGGLATTANPTCERTAIDRP